MARSPWHNLRRTHLKRRRHGPVDGGFTEPDKASPAAVNWDDVCTIKSVIINTAGLHCEGCGRATPPGHTVFRISDEHLYGHLLCYDCGIAVRDVLGLTAITEAVDVPAYGGGPNSRSA